MQTLRCAIKNAMQVVWATAASLNRLLYVGVGLLGMGALLLSMLNSWFEVPQAPMGGANSALDMIALKPESTPEFQALMGIGLICLIASWFRRHHSLAPNTDVTNITRHNTTPSLQEQRLRLPGIRPAPQAHRA